MPPHHSPAWGVVAGAILVLVLVVQVSLVAPPAVALGLA